MLKCTDRERKILGFGLWFLIAIVIGFVLAGCNTVAGLGQDLSAAAKGIQEKMATPSASRMRMNDEGIYYVNE
jgi:predicted small secreted protein